jgi:hypothetical protein
MRSELSEEKFKGSGYEKFRVTSDNFYRVAYLFCSD